MKGDIFLQIREPERKKQSYPSCRLQKGLLLFKRNKDLSEEGVGFGLPILKSGEKTIFPGSANIELKEYADKIIVMVDYDLNMAETIVVKSKKIKDRTLYKIKESLSFVHRKYPCSRELITRGSNELRRSFGIETGFEEAASAGWASIKYTITSDGIIHISADLSRLKKDICTEVMIMNEQGANFFNIYCDSKGTILSGDAIGSWQESSCDEISFIHSRNHLTFTLSRVGGSKMYYGRERVGNRLSWSGIAYSISPQIQDFAYDIKIGMKR